MSREKITVAQIARLLNIEPKENWKEIYITSVCSPRNVKNPCAVFISDKTQLKELSDLPTLLVVKNDIPVEGIDIEKTVLLKVSNPKLALALVLKELYPVHHPVGISSKATISENVKIGKDCYIGDFVYIAPNVEIGNNVKIYPGCYIGENSRIGDNTVIYPNVVIYPNTVIGKDCIIHAGTVVGSDGFGYVFDGKKHIKIPHVGVVVIEDHVEVGANTTIDRAMLEKTLIGEGTKIDNLVMVGHNNRIGKHVILVSQVGLSGSVEIGDYSILAGQVGVADHVKIGKKVIVTAKSGVASDLEEGKVYGANLPAVEWTRWKRIYSLLLKLPELVKDMKKLLKKKK